MSKPSTSPTRAKTGEGATAPHPHQTEPDDEADGNDASTLIENPVKPGEGSKLKQHSFPDGGGSGGAEAFRRGPAPGEAVTRCLMKLATFNVNGIKTRLPQLLDWLAKESPDVVCLQELKALDGVFPRTALEDAGYGALFKGQRSWNGVAILARGEAPLEIRRELPGDPADDQSRYLEAAVDGIVMACLYLPNGNPQPGPKFDYKLAWFKRLQKHAAGLYASGHPVALAGDFNVIPTDLDVYNPKSWKRDALMQPESRAAYEKLLAQGWVDSLRHLNPDERIYTFWDYFRQHWQQDKGLRIDHILLNAALAPRLKSAGVDRWVRGEEHASDHAPVWVELGAAAGKAAAKAGKAAPRKKAA